MRYRAPRVLHSIRFTLTAVMAGMLGVSAVLAAYGLVTLDTMRAAMVKLASEDLSHLVLAQKVADAVVLLGDRLTAMPSIGLEVERQEHVRDILDRIERTRAGVGTVRRSLEGMSGTPAAQLVDRLEEELEILRQHVVEFDQLLTQRIGLRERRVALGKEIAKAYEAYVVAVDDVARQMRGLVARALAIDVPDAAAANLLDRRLDTFLERELSWLGTAQDLRADGSELSAVAGSVTLETDAVAIDRHADEWRRISLRILLYRRLPATPAIQTFATRAEELTRLAVQDSQASLFSLRKSELDAERRVAAAYTHLEEAAKHLHLDATNLVTAFSGGIEIAVQDANRHVTFARQVLLSLMLCSAAFSLYALRRFVIDKIIRRVEGLKESMLQATSDAKRGAQSTLDEHMQGLIRGSGRDEIAAMGESLLVFLDALAEREEARARASADLAAKETLLLSEKRLRQIIDLVPHFIFAKDVEGRFVLVNRAVADAHGTTVEDLTGKIGADCVTSEKAGAFCHGDDLEIIRSGQPRLIAEERITDATGHVRLLTTVKIPFTFSGMSAPSVLGVSVDITERKQAERALRARTAQLDAVRAVGTELTSELDLSTLLHLIIQRAAELLQGGGAAVYLVDAATGRLILHAWYGPQDESLAAQQVDLGEGVVGLVAQSRQGRTVNDYRTWDCARPVILQHTTITAVIGEPLLYQERLLGVVVVDNQGTEKQFTDEDSRLLGMFAAQAAITIENARLYAARERAYEDLQRAQDELIRTEKLRALGEMAAGIAHDLNNTLAAILGQAELLRLRAASVDVREGLVFLETAAADGAQVVRRLQDFARQRTQSSDLQPVSLTALVQETLEITSPRWKDEAERRGAQIEVRVDLGVLPASRGNPAEIREALTNIIFNAVDAMPGGGVLTVKGSATSDAVFIRITDTGIGMPPEVQRKIFDPFFTTKGLKGTGLGLAVVYGIMERHGGQVAVTSTPGQGTAFTLRFQRALETAPTCPAIEASLTAVPPRRLLVIDDEARVRQTVAALLRSAGHEVFEAETGADGMALLERTCVDLVFTDLGMPEMTGWEVARAVKARNSQQPIVLLTGWQEQASGDEAHRQAVDAILGKPVRLEDLCRVIAELTLAR